MWSLSAGIGPATNGRHASMAINVVDMMKQALAEKIGPLNELSEKVKSAAKVSGKVVSEVRNDEAKGEEYPWLKEYQEWEDDVNKLLSEKREEVNARIKAEIIGGGDDGFDVDAAQEELKAGIAEVKVELKALKTLNEDAYEEVASTLKAVSVRQSSGSGDTKRPRLREAYVDSEQVRDEETGKVSFTSLAKYLSKISGASVAGSDLQQAAFTAAGTSTLSDVSGETVEFEFAVSEDGAEYSITVVPA